ncbi:MAG UNVERIFIED_CONTAM: hypothetical protein LVT10_13915 [Anaerolineae bacterium]
MIHQLSQHGQTVQVITLMAGMPTPPIPDTPIVRSLHARWGGHAEPVALRIQEDHDAVASLGRRFFIFQFPIASIEQTRVGTPCTLAKHPCGQLLTLMILPCLICARGRSRQQQRSW